MKLITSIAIGTSIGLSLTWFLFSSLSSLQRQTAQNTADIQYIADFLKSNIKNNQ